MGLIPFIIAAKSSKKYYSGGTDPNYENGPYREVGKSDHGFWIRYNAEEKATMKIEKKYGTIDKKKQIKILKSALRALRSRKLLKKAPHVAAVFLAIAALTAGIAFTGHFGYAFIQNLDTSNLLLTFGSMAGGLFLTDLLQKISGMVKYEEDKKGDVISINDEIDKIKDEIYDLKCDIKEGRTW